MNCFPIRSSVATGRHVHQQNSEGFKEVPLGVFHQPSDQDGIRETCLKSHLPPIGMPAIQRDMGYSQLQ
jgi:hypothetical protein